MIALEKYIVNSNIQNFFSLVNIIYRLSPRDFFVDQEKEFFLSFIRSFLASKKNEPVTNQK